MVYILAVNPSLLSLSNGGKDYSGVFFLGTIISSFVATLAMGLYAKVPVALAPGMGVNAFFSFTVAGKIMGLQIQDALIATFVSGILYFIIALTPLRNLMNKLLSKNLKIGIGAMIGLFLAYIGLNDSGIIVSDAQNIGGNFLVSATKTKFGNIKDPFVIIAIITVLLVFILHFTKVKGSALIAMMAAIIMIAIAMGSGVTDAKNAFVIQQYSSFDKFGELGNKMWSSVGSALSNGKIYIAIFVFLYLDFFDTTGTLFAVDSQANLSKKNPKWIKKANVVDACSTIFGATMFSSTVTSYVESTVGVSQGARTGFASVITSLMFALSILLWPIMSPLMPIKHAIELLPTQNNAFEPTIMPVTGPILVFVGALMLTQLKNFEWNKSIEIPALFMTLIVGMLSFSVSSGIAVGIIVNMIMNSSVYIAKLIALKRGKKFQIDEYDNKDLNISLKKIREENFNPLMICLTLLAIAYFVSMIWWAY